MKNLFKTADISHVYRETADISHVYRETADISHVYRETADVSHVYRETADVSHVYRAGIAALDTPYDYPRIIQVPHVHHSDSEDEESS